MYSGVCSDIVVEGVETTFIEKGLFEQVARSSGNPSPFRLPSAGSQRGLLNPPIFLIQNASLLLRLYLLSMGSG